MKLCLDFLSAPEASPVDLVRLAAQENLSRVSLPVLSSPDLPDWNLAGDKEMQRQIRQIAGDHGIAFDALEVLCLDPDVYVEGFRSLFEAAAYLHAQTAVMVTTDPVMSRLLDNTYRLCDLADEHGVQVVLEYTPRMQQKSFADALAFVNLVDRKIKIECDALHTFRSGSDLHQISQAAQGLIPRAQLCDGPDHINPAYGRHEAMFERHLPGDGDLPLIDFLRALPQDVTLGLEVPMRKLSESGYGAEKRVAMIVQKSRALLELAGITAT